jgi:hypothetical protein
MAHLGLARAHARSGAIAESRAAYDELLAIWAGADPDLPMLRTVRDERAALEGQEPSPAFHYTTVGTRPDP